MKPFSRIAITVLCLAGMTGLSGCGQSLYPRLSNLTGIGDSALTPEQQQQAITDLATEQKAHGTQAVEEIEKRN
jgi:hypothetical protein